MASRIQRASGGGSLWASNVDEESGLGEEDAEEKKENVMSNINALRKLESKVIGEAEALNAKLQSVNPASELALSQIATKLKAMGFKGPKLHKESAWGDWEFLTPDGGKVVISGWHGKDSRTAAMVLGVVRGEDGDSWSAKYASSGDELPDYKVIGGVMMASQKDVDEYKSKVLPTIVAKAVEYGNKSKDPRP